MGDREGGDNQSPVNFVDDTPKTCHTGFRRSDQPQNVHNSPNQPTPNLTTDNRKLRHLPFNKSLRKERAYYMKNKTTNSPPREQDIQQLTSTNRIHITSDSDNNETDENNYQRSINATKTKPKNPNPTVYTEKTNEPCCSHPSRDTYHNVYEIPFNNTSEERTTTPNSKNYVDDTDVAHCSYNIRRDTNTTQSNTDDKKIFITNPDNHVRDTRKPYNRRNIRQEQTFLNAKKVSFKDLQHTNDNRNSQNTLTKETAERTINEEDRDLPVPTNHSETIRAPRKKTSIMRPTTATTNNTIDPQTPRSARHMWAFEIRNMTRIHKKNLPQHLLFVIDNSSGVLFIIDSGCEISLIPKNLTNGIDHYFHPQSKTITGIGDSLIHPIGSIEVNLELGEIKHITHTFWVTQEIRDYGIIGLDLLRSNCLVISPHSSRLYKPHTDQSAELYTAETLPDSVLNPTQAEQRNTNDITLEERCKQLLENFPELTEYPDYTKPIKHNHFLEIIVEDFKPKLIKARKCNGAKRDAVVENFADLIQRGAMSRGIADMCASPITIVPKKDGTMRVCVDYTFLNAHTRPLCYPLPRIDDLPEIVPGGTRFFSNLDLKEAYYSLPIHPNSRDYAAIIAHHGVFVPNRTPFGLKNAPMRFQQMMECILSSCKQFTFVYLDDILVFSSSENEHLEHLEMVFRTLNDNGLYLNKKKCVFAKPKVSFLGHSVGIEGIDILEEKVKTIRELPMPGNRRELKKFLGMVNYYFNHIPKLAETTKLLTEISGGPKSSNKKRLQLNDAQKKAYHDTIEALANASTLAFEQHGKPLIIYCDASDNYIGAVLEQESDEGDRRPLAFFSKKLSAFKRVRSTFYKELRALYVSIRHFQHRIIGRKLIVRTDSQAVEKAVNNPLGNQSPTEQRYIAAIKEYSPVVIHISGKDNQVADYLSRPPSPVVLHARTHEEDPDYSCSSCSDTDNSLSEYQQSEEEEELITADSLNRIEIARLQAEEQDLIEHAIKLNKNVKYEDSEGLAVISEGENVRIILPTPLRLTAFEVAHGYIHLGKEKSVLATAKDYWWPTLTQDVEYWVKTCVVCQATKVTRHNRPKIGFYPSNSERFQYVHMDLVGPLSIESEENRYILTAKDRSTGFLVTTPIKNKKAETVRKAFIQSWCSVFGIPQVVVTDNGREFKNAIFSDTFEQLGIDHHFVPIYSPSSNGYIERQHRTINVALRALTEEKNWSLHLPLITAEINNTFIDGNLFTPSQYALGTCTNLSGRLMFNKVDNKRTETRAFDTLRFLFSMSNIGRRHKRHYNKLVYYEPELFNCEKVWIRKPTKTHLSPLYHGPYVVKSANSQSMIVQKNARLIKVPINLIKGYYPREDLNEKGEKQGRTHGYNLRERKIARKYAKISSNSDSQ